MIKLLDGAGGVLLCALGIAGCGDDGVSDTAQACRDVADAVARAAVRCAGGSYQSTYDAFVGTAAAGDCSNVVAIRDRAVLYDQCIPALEAITCPNLLEGIIDDSCRGQLLR